MDTLTSRAQTCVSHHDVEKQLHACAASVVEEQPNAAYVPYCVHCNPHHSPVPIMRGSRDILFGYSHDF